MQSRSMSLVRSFKKMKSRTAWPVGFGWWRALRFSGKASLSRPKRVHISERESLVVDRLPWITSLWALSTIGFALREQECRNRRSRRWSCSWGGRSSTIEASISLWVVDGRFRRRRMLFRQAQKNASESAMLHSVEP